ncbi:MAG: hypothetical protein VB913_09255 [Rhodospirillales bacterium]
MIRIFALLILPTIFLISSTLLKLDAGPTWLWSNLDPDYWYLFDSLNMVNLNWPQHIAHPGTTVQFIGAVVIKAVFPFTAPEQINLMVLADPEHYLDLISGVLISLNAAAMVFIGVAGFLAFKDIVGALFLQMGPFLSQLTLKFSLHVAPEPMLIATILVLCGVMMLALRPGQLEKHRNAYVLTFAIIAGFGIATKVTSAGLYLMPLFLLGRFRPIILYGVASVFFIVIFTLPATGSYPKIFDFLLVVALGNQHFGGGDLTIIDLATYPRNLLRVSSRPMFWVILMVSMIMVWVARWKRRDEDVARENSIKALAGLCLAFVAQGLIVAKHPAGHYMIPALTASAMGLALIYFLSKALCDPAGKGRQAVRIGFFIFLLLLIGSNGRTIYKLDQELIGRVTKAQSINESLYFECAKIYFWPTSNPLYALFLASWNTDNSFADVLQRLYPSQSSVFITPKGVLKGMAKTRDLQSIANNYPCIYVRGSPLFVDPGKYILPFSDLAFSKISKMETCHNGDESIFTWGIDCQIESNR